MTTFRRSNILSIEIVLLLSISLFSVGIISKTYDIYKQDFGNVQCTLNVFHYMPYTIRNLNELCEIPNIEIMIFLYFISGILIVVSSNLAYLHGRIKTKFNIWPIYYKIGLLFIFFGTIIVWIIGGESRRLDASGLHHGSIFFYVAFSIVVPLSQWAYFTLYYEERD